jgi:hypothetical protein
MGHHIDFARLPVFVKLDPCTLVRVSLRVVVIRFLMAFCAFLDVLEAVPMVYETPLDAPDFPF